MKIKTINGIYTYTQKELFHGRKYIDIEIATHNLLDFKTVLDSNKVDFGIIFGTLLGAIRENNFIKHDEDVDVFIIEESKSAFLSLLFVFREMGFEVARYEGKILSLIRNDNYIDIYFFKKNLFGQRVCGGYVLKAELLEYLDQISFLNQTFNTPMNPIHFLEKFYGKDWKTPKENAHATNFSIKVKSFLKKIIPKPLLRILKSCR